MARNALATTARAVKATAGQWLVLFFLTFVLACPAISMAADAAATAPAAQTNVVTVADAQDTAVTPSPVAATTGDVQTAQVVDNHPWWFWPVALLFFCFILGIIAVMAGVGGGVLFVPLVSGFFPFHLDFVRGAGLLVALAGALAAGPGLLRRNFANLRLALPVALIASACSIVGAGEVVDWKTHRTLAGLLLFIVIGIMAGMFGLGAGWANVPVLNLLMGVPLKVSVGTSKFLLSITDTSAAWVYLNQGCVIPLMAIPSIVGLMLGSVVGVRLLAKAKPKFIRIMVIAVLFFSGAKALLKGLGW